MARVVFMGSPEFAVPSLRALTRQYDVVGVVTQPDRPAGRGRELRPPALKEEAGKIGIPVIQPDKLVNPQALDQIRAWAPDVIVVAAFGQILKPEMLELPRHGCVNVHASLLPRWRGAAPIQAAIAAGDAQSGVTIMKMDVGMDTGGILAQTNVPIGPDETGGSLTGRLASIGAELLIATLAEFLSGRLQPQPQDPEKATKAPLLKKEDAALNTLVAAVDLERRVRAYNPWPGAYTEVGNMRLIVHRAHVARTTAPSGSRQIIDDLPAIATKDGALVLDEVQPPGKKRMNGRDYLRGARGWTA
ncbi:MAG TPA: methionyl-tRNA formyltransferase [Anaerolineales bacterium]